MIKGILFDLDGVIVDTAVYHYKAWRRLANELGFDFDEEFNETLKGISRMDSLDKILEKGNIVLNQSDKDKYAQLKNDWYLAYISVMDPSNILVGVTDFIEQAKEKNIKIGLGSASKNAPIILRNIGLFDEFDIIVDGNNVTKSKPDPEVFLKGAKLLNLKPKECIVVEDAFSGIEAAHSAGMKAIGIGSKEALPNADLLATNLSEIKLEEIINL